MRLRNLACFFLIGFLSATAVTAEERLLRFGGLMVNDSFGDIRDRWRTGAAVLSFVRAESRQPSLPSALGDLWEFRLGAEVVAPRYLADPGGGDRPYAGILSFGAHTHAQIAATQISIGADLVIVGPQTGLSNFQRALHDVVDFTRPSDAVRAAQIADDIFPTLVIEAARPIRMNQRSHLRPFVEYRAGVETMLRAGADLYLGGAEPGSLMVRESSTGHRYRAASAGPDGFSFMLGADTARVFDSELLPASRGAEPTEYRHRMRAGVKWNGEESSVFYGLTWHGEEFRGQNGSQVTGAVQFNFRF